MSVGPHDVVAKTNEKIRKDRRRQLKRRALLSFAVVSVLIGAVSFIAYRPHARVQTVAVLGTETLSVYDIEEIVHDRIDGAFVYLFPRNTIFFINKHALEREVVNAYPRVETIDISIENRELLVLIQERQASYLWCGPVAFAEINDQETCYYFDKTGFIFDTAPYFSAAVYFTLYDTAIGGEKGSFIGSTISHAGQIEPLLSFVASLETLGIRGFALELGERDATLYLGNTKDTDAPKVIWRIDEDYTLLGSNLQSALGAEPMKSEVLGGEKKLDYIDLRYQDKVYYKLK